MFRRLNVVWWHVLRVCYDLPMSIYTVTQLNSDIRKAIEQGFGHVWLMGEISNFAAPNSGHWYLTLKDERAQIRCAMFRGNNQRAKVRPQNGLQVLVRGRVTVYEPRGDYQLIVEHMEEAGIGLLQQQFEQLKVKLATEGLFAQERKRPLPEHIRRVGVITSPTGAAIQDVLAVMKRRDPSVDVIIYPTAVQGDAAIPQIKNALHTAFQRNEVDVLIVTRGGGSLEDLWCFNDEQVGRLLLDAPMPVISAVGHEVDFTICDFIADLRAPTPSAAAEQVTQDRSAQINRLQQLQQRLATGQKRRIERQHSLLQQLQIRLNQQHPQRQLQQQSQRLDELLARVYRAQQRTLVSQQQRRQHVIQRLQQVHPQRELSRAQQKLSQIQQRIPLVAEAWLKQQHQRHRALLHALNLVSPLNTLDRGYAIVRDEEGHVITQPEQTQAEQKLSVKVAGGEFNVRKCSE